MARRLSQAGFFVLKSLRIVPMYPGETTASQNNLGDGVDITKVVTKFGISEGINSPYVSGSCEVVESDNVLEDLPIRGEESLQMVVTDFYGETKTYNFIVYAVEDIGPVDSTTDRVMKYTLKFTTNDKLNADTKEIRKSFANTKISEMAQILFDEYYSDSNKEIEIEATDGEQTLVIPSLRPDAAMHFLSRRAYSATNKTSLYRFFETREKYYFCTHEYLIEKYKGFLGFSEESRNRLFFNYSVVEDNSGPGQLRAQQSINDITYGTKVDSFEDMKAGTYRRNVTELDILNRTRIHRQYDYSAEYQQYKAPERLKLTHSEEFVNSYMPSALAPSELLLTDFAQIGQNRSEVDRPYQHFYENYTTKPIVDYHLNRNSFTVDIHGRHEMYPGMLVNLNLYKFSNSLADLREDDTERSGDYLVMGVANVFNGDLWTQTLTVTKGGLS